MIEKANINMKDDLKLKAKSNFILKRENQENM